MLAQGLLPSCIHLPIIEEGFAVMINVYSMCSAGSPVLGLVFDS